jgi:hypothetical protein
MREENSLVKGMITAFTGDASSGSFVMSLASCYEMPVANPMQMKKTLIVGHESNQSGHQ